MFYHGVNAALESRFLRSMEQREYEKIIGPTTKTILYNVSKKFSVKMFSNFLGYEKSKKESLENMLKLLPTLGYGVFKLINYDEDKLEFKVTAWNSYNATVYEGGGTEKPICYELSGFLAGMFEIIFEKEMICEEEKCISMGEKFCNFKIKKSTGKGVRKVTHHRVKSVVEIPKNLQKLEFKFDEEKGEIYPADMNQAVFPREMRAGIQQEFERIIGPAIKTISYKVSKEGAIYDIKRILKKNLLARVILFLNKKKFIYELFKVSAISGNGAMELTEINFKKSTGRIEVKNCHNTLNYGNMKKPICYYTMGVIAGAAEVIFNKRLECKETKCKTQGYEKCEFEVFSSE